MRSDKAPLPTVTVLCATNLIMVTVASILVTLCLLFDERVYCQSESLVTAIISWQNAALFWPVVTIHILLYATPIMILRRQFAGNVLLLPINALTLLGGVWCTSFALNEDCSFSYGTNYVLPLLIVYIPPMCVFLLVGISAIVYKLLRRWLRAPRPAQQGSRD